MVLVGLLDEPLDPAHALLVVRILGGDIAIAGRRMIGLDPEGDDVARLGGGAPGLDRGMEGRLVGNMMIARSSSATVRRDRRQARRARPPARCRASSARGSASPRHARSAVARAPPPAPRWRRRSAAQSVRCPRTARASARTGWSSPISGNKCLGCCRGRHRPQPRPRSARQDHRANAAPITLFHNLPFTIKPAARHLFPCPLPRPTCFATRHFRPRPLFTLYL